LRRGIRILTSFTLCLNAKGERSLLFSMQIGDDIIYDLDGISEHVISYYQHLFSDLDDCSLDLSIVWDHIPTLVTSDENTFILPVPSYDELRERIFYMDPLSAPRSEGFASRFYKHCWDIIGQDVILAV